MYQTRIFGLFPPPFDCCGFYSTYIIHLQYSNNLFWANNNNLKVDPPIKSRGILFVFNDIPVSFWTTKHSYDEFNNCSLSKLLSYNRFACTTCLSPFSHHLINIIRETWLPDARVALAVLGLWRGRVSDEGRESTHVKNVFGGFKIKIKTRASTRLVHAIIITQYHSHGYDRNTFFVYNLGFDCFFVV